MGEGLFFSKVAVIGVGLIGGSLAIVMRKKGLAGSIVGVGRGLANLEAAKRLGVVDSFTHDVAEGVADADLVVVAVPVLKVGETVKRAAPALKMGAIVTDVGSVKKALIEEAERYIPEGVHFVPGHPIAGTEHSGVEAAFAELYVNRRCILTPTDRTDSEALAKVRRLWEEAGSKVVIMDASAHDSVLAAISHLPHMVAYSLVNAVADAEEGKGEMLGYSAGGFKDFTRIASSSPEMWADICAMNKEAIVEMIDFFERRLDDLKEKIKAADHAGLVRDFSRAKRLRDALVHGGGQGGGK